MKTFLFSIQLLALRSFVGVVTNKEFENRNEF